MSKNIYFDSDFTSAFLQVSSLNIPLMILDGSIIIPQQVYNELKKAKKENFIEQIDRAVKAKQAIIQDLEVFSDIGQLYFKFHENGDGDLLAVGSGEAAAMALAISNHGILASNNLKDVMPYVKKYKIEHITTGIVMHNAVENGYITKEYASELWGKMIANGCKLGAQTYEEYVSEKRYQL